MQTQARKLIAAFQMSLDGYIQGAGGEVGWITDWSDALGLVPEARAAVIGGGTFGGYEMLWGSIAADPASGAGLLGREPTPGELAYAQWTQRTPHYVLSSSLAKVSWPGARLVRSTGQLRSLLAQPGGDVYVIGGAAVISGLLRESLLDELRLVVCPVILGGGRDPFAGMAGRRALELTGCRPGRAGTAVLTCRA